MGNFNLSDKATGNGAFSRGQHSSTVGAGQQLPQMCFTDIRPVIRRCKHLSRLFVIILGITTKSVIRHSNVSTQGLTICIRLYEARVSESNTRTHETIISKEEVKQIAICTVACAG